MRAADKKPDTRRHNISIGKEAESESGVKGARVYIGGPA